MRLLFTALAILISVTFFSQKESRLALVIGNANYDEGELKNPVNDALLIASTLESLGFEIILDTNISSRTEFIRTIRTFGNKRELYDVACVYYAGHGVQIDSENYLLPTKEIYESEEDVMDFGVSVQNILRYLESHGDKVNIFILDACRNNPFEQIWKSERSLTGGSGLAKINPATGSLIAYSTEANTTASDGMGDNSLYCQALCENLLIKGLSIDQVFRNVRKSVLTATNEQQRPIEQSLLTGNAYIVNKTDYNVIEQDIIRTISDNLHLNMITVDEDLYLTLSNQLTQISKYNQDNIYGKIVRLLICIKKIGDKWEEEISQDLISEFEQIYTSIDLMTEDQSIVRYIKYLNMRFLHIKALSFYNTHDISRLDENQRIKCYTSVMERIGQINEIKSNIDNTLFLKNWGDHYGFGYTDMFISSYLASELGDLEYYKESIAIYEKQIKIAQDFYLSNEDYYMSHPEEGSVIKDFGIVNTQVHYINVMKKSGLYSENIITELWRELYKKNKNNSNLLITRSRKLMSLSEYDFAHSLIDRVTTIEPLDPEPYLLLYLIDLENQDFTSALIHLNYSIERLDTDDNYWIGESIFKLGMSELNKEGFDPNEEQVSVDDLILLRIKLYHEMGQTEMMCEELDNLLNNIRDNDNLQEIKELIKENCH